MQPKLIIAFEDLTEPAFLVKVGTIDTSLTGNVDFPLPWPTGVPDPPAIATAVTAYKAAYDAAKNGDRALIKVRGTARIALTKKLKKVATYLELTADGDVAKLATTGYDLRHDIVKSITTEPLGPLAGLKVTRASLSGGLIVHATAASGADVYDVEIASADPSVEANWSDGGTHAHCNRIELKGLTPGKTYYVRICGFNKNGRGVWATSAGIQVL